jgi:hypothetical protein
MLGLIFSGVSTNEVIGQDAVHGAQVYKRTKALVQSIAWSSSLEDLKAEASRTGKMIFWLQLVGDLDEGL